MKKKWNFTLISFFTESYSAGAARLEASCERFGIQSEIIPSAFRDQTQADWRRNTFAKAEFIRSQMARIDGPLVWVDADAEIQRPPILFDELAEGAATLAAYSRNPGRIRSGTIWFSNDQISRDIVDQWIKMNIESFMLPCPPMAPQEQKNLMEAVRNHYNSMAFYNLPLAYCRIQGYSKDDQAEMEDPVILHFQKSREYRRGKG